MNTFVQLELASLVPRPLPPERSTWSVNETGHYFEYCTVTGSFPDYT